MQAVVTYIRNIDIRKLAVVLGFLTLVEQGIVNKDFVLDGAVPAAWIPYIIVWCKNFIFINGLILIGQPATAVKWPTAPSAAVKAAIVGLAIGLAAMMPRAASAQTSSVATAVQTTVQQVEAVLNALINDGQQFVTADLNLAIADAQAQTPPNAVAAACWTAIEGLNFTAIPSGAGVAYLQQRLLDAQAQYVSINQNCNGVAPLFVKAYNAFVTQAQALNL